MLNIQPANDGHFIRCLPELEKEIGEKPAKLLLQLDHWIRISTTEEIQGKRWTYQSTPDIQEKAFPSWSQSTINRVIKKLETLHLIVIDKFNKAKYDKTRWFALDPVGIGQLKSIVLINDDLRSTQNDARSNQIDLRSTQNDARSNQIGGTIPETPTEITPETPTEKTPAAARADAGAAGSQSSPDSKNLIDENTKPPVKAEAAGRAAITERPTQPTAHTPSPSVPPVSPAPTDDDLQVFFNGCTAAELVAMVKQYGKDRIWALINEVRLLPNVDSPPALVRYKLRLGAQAAWTWPTRNESGGKRYISGKYADFIEH